MNVEVIIQVGVHSLESLAPAVPALEGDEILLRDIERAESRGYFKPDEDERLRDWQARYLTVRAGLLETIHDLKPIAMDGTSTPAGGTIDEADRLRAFLLAYTATCLLIRAARHLINTVAANTIAQRKLNEASPRHRIPRKQYTRVFRALTNPHNAWQISEAMRFADDHRDALEALSHEGRFVNVWSFLQQCEESLRVSVGQYVKARLRYRWHAWRRRRASAVQQGLFAILEASGRLIADVSYWVHAHRVDAGIVEALGKLLRPGDVMITRHDHALTNLFLPGYWPHAALYVGTEAERRALNVTLAGDQAERWIPPIRVLEAKKDGVHFRALRETLSVDAVAVIRPTLTRDEIAEAVSRAVKHEGKLYNFDFDFFTEDKLVCTEVVYRAYDGVGSVQFDLAPRAGRVTISAEDLLDMALEDRGFEPVAVFGAPGCEGKLVTGSRTARVLSHTYRDQKEPVPEVGDSYNQ